MPVAGQDPVLDTAAVEWETHVRTTIVKGVNVSGIIDQQDRGMAAMHDEAPLVLQIGQGSYMYEVRGFAIHRCVPRSFASRPFQSLAFTGGAEAFGRTGWH